VGTPFSLLKSCPNVPTLIIIIIIIIIIGIFVKRHKVVTSEGV